MSQIDDELSDLNRRFRELKEREAMIEANRPRGVGVTLALIAVIAMAFLLIATGSQWAGLGVLFLFFAVPGVALIALLDWLNGRSIG